MDLSIGDGLSAGGADAWHRIERWWLWTDEVVRQIQLRVFRHKKKLAEADTQLSAGR